MSQGLEVDVKQIVVSSGSFGPQEINQLIASIREDQANYRVLREAAEIELRQLDEAAQARVDADAHDAQRRPELERKLRNGRQPNPGSGGAGSTRPT